MYIFNNDISDCSNGQLSGAPSKYGAPGNCLPCLPHCYASGHTNSTTPIYLQWVYPEHQWVWSSSVIFKDSSTSQINNPSWATLLISVLSSSAIEKATNVFQLMVHVSCKVLNSFSHSISWQANTGKSLFFSQDTQAPLPLSFTSWWIFPLRRVLMLVRFHWQSNSWPLQLHQFLLFLWTLVAFLSKLMLNHYLFPFGAVQCIYHISLRVSVPFNVVLFVHSHGLWAD